MGGLRHPPSALPRERDPVFIVMDARWVLRPIWTGAQNLAPTGITSLNLLPRSELLYGLSYPDPLVRDMAWLTVTIHYNESYFKR